MRFISAVVYYCIIIPVSLLPFPAMYFCSGFLYYLLYYVFPYRKKIVLENLRHSFPGKTEAEIRAITRKFYRHFCDLVFETIKLFTASPASILARVELANTELLNKYFHQGKSLVLVTGHFANWEWPASTLPFHSHHAGTGIYKKLSNSFFDEKLRKTRARYGMKLMNTREVPVFFEKHADELCTYGFINDQSPSDPKKGYWMKWLNQDTCFFPGAEKYAVMYDYPVIYGKISRKKRGYYKIEYELVSENPASSRPFEITEACARINEKLISESPEFWLWTHRRWKHRKPADGLPRVHSEHMTSISR